MKETMLQVARAVLYPLYWCHQVIMDAPVLDFDQEAIHFGECDRFFLQEPARSGKPHKAAF